MDFASPEGTDQGTPKVRFGKKTMPATESAARNQKNNPPAKPGKTFSVRPVDPHPAVAPDTAKHRDARLAKVADKFEEHPSVVEKIKAKDVPDSKVRGKAQPRQPDEFAVVSPTTRRDDAITRESSKFEGRAGIAQLMGQKDRQREAAAHPTGKSKSVRPDLHPALADSHRDREGVVGSERDKFIDKPEGVLQKLGTQDHPVTSRKRVVAGSGSDETRKTTREMLCPEPGPHVKHMRRGHATADIVHTFEDAITARKAQRESAQAAMAAAVDFIGTFSESDGAKPFHPSLKHVTHDRPEYKSMRKISDPVLGFPGLGSRCWEPVHGCKHFDPAALNQAARAKQARREAHEHNHSARRFDRTLDSSDVVGCLSHPDHRPFVAKKDKSGAVHAARRSAADSAGWPEWAETTASRARERESQARGTQHQHQRSPPRREGGRAHAPQHATTQTKFW